MSKNKMFFDIRIVVAVIMSMSLVGNVFLYKIYEREYKSVARYEKEINPYRNNQNKLQYIEKTLLVTYDNLSQPEAHYYAIVFNDFSNTYNIPWEIYPAIIRIESNFDVTAHSEKGAKGLTQVIESTGVRIATKLNIPYEKDKTLWNDILNMTIGFTYLSEAIQEKGLEDGVKAYIGGLGFQKGRKDIRQYRTTVDAEYKKIQYIYKGVVNE